MTRRSRAYLNEFESVCAQAQAPTRCCAGGAGAAAAWAARPGRRGPGRFCSGSHRAEPAGSGSALLGGCHGFYATTDRPWMQARRAVYAYILAAVRAQLKAPTFATAWAEGRTITLAQAIAYA